MLPCHDDAPFSRRQPECPALTPRDSHQPEGETAIDPLAGDGPGAAVLRSILIEGAGLGPDDFLRHGVERLAAILGVDWAHVAEPCPEAPGMMQTLAVWHDGAARPGFRYAIAGTPCAVTLDEDSCLYPAAVQRLFPDDPDLADLGAEAYAGVRLRGRTGELLGVLSVMSRRLITESGSLASSLRLAAVGIGAALERRAAEAMAAGSAALSRSLLDTLDAQIVVLDDAGCIVFSNRTWDERALACGLPAGMAAAGRDYRGEYLDSGGDVPRTARAGALLGEVIEGVRHHGSIEYTRTEDGGERWYRCTIKRIVAPAAARVLVAHEDTTGYRLAQRRSDQIERQFRHMFDSAPDAMLIVDRTGLIRLANHRAEAMFGYLAHELEGQPVEVLINARERPRHERLRHDFVHSERSSAMGDSRSALQGQRRDGIEFPVEISLSRFAGDGDEYIIASVRDVSNRLQAQADRMARQVAEEASEAKSIFLATMSHEIRTPLNAVLGLAEVLAQSTLSYDQAQLLNTMRGSAQHLLRLIDDVLDFSKIEAGSLEIEQSPVDLVALIESTSRSLANHAAERGVELHLFVAPDVPRRVLSDEVRLRQIIYNLLGNAIKFSADSRRRIGSAMLRAEFEPGAPAILRLEFIDNGIGMAPEVVERVFMPFTQAEGTTTRKFGGTGLGLTISKRIIDRIGGSISVDSAPGRGTAFVVRLALAPLDEPAVPDPQPLLGISCLLSDSAAYVAADLGRTLRHLGARVVDATGLAGPGDGAGDGPAVLIRGEDDPPPTGLPAAAPQVLIGHDGSRRLAIRSRGRVFVEARAMTAADLARAVTLAAGGAEAGSPSVEPAQPCGLRPAFALGPDDPPPLLVAEDDLVNQKVILRQLQLLGLRADLAGDGAEALRRWRRGNYRLLLTDLHMPGMDGYALTRAIRADEARQRQGVRLPIIALTANALRDELSRARTAGLDGFLTKPIALDRLGRALAEWLPAVIPEPPTPGAVVPLRLATIDTSGHQRLIGTDRDSVLDFLKAYRQVSVELVARLEGLIAGDNCAEAAMVFHRLKSSSRWIGALAFGDMCETLEDTAREGDARHLASRLAEFCRQHALVLADLDRLCAAPG